MSAPRADAEPLHRWTGCHGVALASQQPLGLARGEGEPLLRATVAVGAVKPAGGTELWRLTSYSTGGLAFHQRLDELPGGRLLLRADGRRTIEVAPVTRHLTATPPLDHVQVQLLTAFALPALLAAEQPATLVLHGATVCRNGTAVLICGPGGAGKSSALVGLVDAGWAALSEDVCAIDLRAPEPRAWPGPPWVRRAHGEPGPRNAPEAFRSTDKTAWALGPAHATTATPLGLVVLLDPPGGATTRWQEVPPAARLAELAKHAVWLGRADERSRALFGPVATLAARVSTTRVRLPRGQRWVEQLAAALERAGL